MATNNYFTNLIGRGMTFPIELTENSAGETGWYPVNGNMELVRNNISAILYYMIGQRIRQEDFGTRLWECLEEPNTQALSFIIKNFLKSAISTWEPRLTFKEITLTRQDAKINIEVCYSVNGSSSSQYIYITYDQNDETLNSY